MKEKPKPGSNITTKTKNCLIFTAKRTSRKCDHIYCKSKRAKAKKSLSPTKAIMSFYSIELKELNLVLNTSIMLRD